MTKFAHHPDNYDMVWEYDNPDIPTFEDLVTQVAADGFGVTPVDGLPPDQLAADVRSERNRRLSEDIDTVNAPRWNSLTAQEQADVSAYRLALLDVPSQSGFPSTVSWPTKPTCL